jgi:HlyD family secretion protein
VAGQDNHFFLKLNIDELDIQRIKKDQKVKVKVDAYPGKIFTATIDKIYPMVTVQAQSLRVDANFDEPLPGSYSGLAVEANIIIREKKDALVIPKTALLTGDSVLIKIDGDTKKVKVIKGIETLDDVEIRSGIDAKQQVVLSQK